MNYAVTTQLIDAITPYIKTDQITVSTANQDWKNRPYTSDLVTIDSLNHVGFEVFDKGIIVFYMTDHTHFDDDSAPTSEDYDYIADAKGFLIRLFQSQIRHKEIFKGKTLSCEKYYLVTPDTPKEELIGCTWHMHVRFANPFAKKRSRSTLWQYDRDQGHFVTCQSSPLT